VFLLRRRYKASGWPTNLHVTFCDIEGGDAGMGEPTGKSTAEHTLGVIVEVMRNRPSKPRRK